jgi:hypothetical protein
LTLHIRIPIFKELFDAVAAVGFGVCDNAEGGRRSMATALADKFFRFRRLQDDAI